VHPYLNFIAKYTYAGIFLSLGMGIVGLPIPDETILAFVGFLIYKGKLFFVPAFLSSVVGTSCGITIGYVIGRFFGHSVIDKHSEWLHLRREHILKARQWVNRYGKFSLLIGYFIPGVRHLTAIIAGASLIPYGVFAMFTYTGGFLWCLTFILFGYLVGEQWHTVLRFMHQHVMPFAVIGVILIVIIGIIFALRRERK